ncbi:hypothetical protein C8Q75DRAFT_471171 [Abortiporus biennis]|nr:hypothetical protein C8Q75DRAFT_471171 [Abortiporus biennis]
MILSLMRKSQLESWASVSSTFRPYALRLLYRDRCLRVCFSNQGSEYGLRHLDDFLDAFRGPNTFELEAFQRRTYIETLHIFDYEGYADRLLLKMLSLFPKVTSVCMFNPMFQIPPNPFPPGKFNLHKKAMASVRRLAKRGIATFSRTRNVELPRLKLQYLAIKQTPGFYDEPCRVLSQLQHLLCHVEEIEWLHLHLIRKQLSRSKHLESPILPLSRDELKRITTKIKRVDLNSPIHSKLSAIPVIQILMQHSISSLTSLSIKNRTVEDCIAIGELAPNCPQLRHLSLVISHDLMVKMKSVLKGERDAMKIFKLSSCVQIDRFTLCMEFEPMKTKPHWESSVTRTNYNNVEINQRLILGPIKDLLSEIPKGVDTLNLKISMLDKDCPVDLQDLRFWETIREAVTSRPHDPLSLRKITVHSMLHWYDWFEIGRGSRRTLNDRIYWYISLALQKTFGDIERAEVIAEICL